MLWIKAFHIILVTSWFAGLFYLPRIFVNHAMATEPAEIARLKLMERKLYRFVTPIGALAIIFGLRSGRQYQAAKPPIRSAAIEE